MLYMYKVVLTFKSVNKTLIYVTIRMKAAEQYSLVLFIILYNEVL